MAKEDSLVILKPDTLERGLIGQVISRIEGLGLQLVAMKTERATSDQLGRHYPDGLADSIGEKGVAAGVVHGDPREYGFRILHLNRTYMSRGPIVVMVWRGEDAIRQIRRVAGYTDPSAAEQGTIRGDLGIDSIKVASGEDRAVENLLHASGSMSEAADEVRIWFPELAKPA